MRYIDYVNTSIPNLNRPNIFSVISELFGKKIDLFIETKNMHEYLWGETPIVNIGLWEGTCVVSGNITIDGKSVDVKGVGISEILRII